MSDPIQDNVDLSAEAQAMKPEPAQGKPESEEVAVLKDQLLRALAEADNTRKRAEKSVQEARAYGIAGFARDLLEVADNLRRAHDAIPEDQKDGALAQGVLATERALLSIFERNGLKKTDPLGEKFDAHLHEVMFEGEGGEGQEKGTVIAVLEPGYLLNDRLLRPARVGVAK